MERETARVRRHRPDDLDDLYLICLRTVAERFPSHLHINLLPRMQGHGMGRQLITTLLSGLRERGSPGVHLLVGEGNQRAVSFYRYLGFTEVPDPDVHIFSMDLRGPAD